jgi:hypothetical protein
MIERIRQPMHFPMTGRAQLDGRQVPAAGFDRHEVVFVQIACLTAGGARFGVRISHGGGFQ